MTLWLLITTLVAWAQPAPYVSLEQDASILVSRHLSKKLFRRDDPKTLRALRDRHALALIHEGYPFNAGSARRLRTTLREWNAPDEIAVLTRDELDFADLLVKYQLNNRARNFMANFRPRTLNDLRAADLNLLEDEDPLSRLAKVQLLRVLQDCQRPLGASYQPRT